jgi:uncharacterized protein
LTDRLSGRDVLWRLLDGIGLEHCRLTSDPDGHVLAGIVVTMEDGSPVTIDYSVRCDRFWHTRDVSVSVARGGSLEVRTLRLTSDGDGSWWSVAAGSENMSLRQISGCIDVDLAFTPATNTLPLRRHDMAVGGRVVVAAAWVQFPSLKLAMLNQRYTRLAVDRYRYDAPDHNFAALLEVDELGLVRTYEGLWERAAESDVTASTWEESSDD